MPSVAIVTDSTALFPNPVFAGRERVSILVPSWDPPPKNGAERLKASDFPESLRGSGAPQLATPTPADFEAMFRQAGANHDGVLAVLHSAEFSKINDAALAAAQTVHGTVHVRVVNSHSASLGLGLMVQTATAAAEAGMALPDLDLYTRSLVPKVYGILCVPGLSYLRRGGFVNPSQALVGEYLDILQVFTLDEGRLVPTQKARNTRQLVDVLHEFLSEFPDLTHIALQQGSPAFEAETRALRERLTEEGLTTAISEQIINAPFASLIGPHSLGLFAIQA